MSADERQLAPREPGPRRVKATADDVMDPAHAETSRGTDTEPYTDFARRAREYLRDAEHALFLEMLRSRNE